MKTNYQINQNVILKNLHFCSRKLAHIKHLLSMLVVGSFFATANLSLAQFSSGQFWTPTGANTNLPWSSIACSADGTKVVATVTGGGIYVSTNSGNAWMLSGAPDTNTFWASIVSSADGTKLAAIDNYIGFVYNSADGGATWTSNYVSDQGLYSIASSADGTRLVVTADNSNVVYTSSNAGVTWSQTDLPATDVAAVACSADGTKLAVTAGAGIFISTNSGITWHISGTPTNQFWNSIASSADGSKLVAGAYSAVFGVSEDSVFTSTESGATWTSNNLPVPGSVSLVTSSADGTRLVAVAEDFSVARVGEIFVSNDSGNTWTEAKAPFASWTGIASSADGSKLFGAAWSAPFGLLDGNQKGGIYISQTIPIPILNLTHSSGNHLTLSWIVPSIGFILQENSGLDPNGWTDIPTFPTLNFTNVQLEIPASPTNAHTFFRLRSFAELPEGMINLQAAH